MAVLQIILFSIISFTFAATIPTEEINTSSPSIPETREACLTNPVDCELCGCYKTAGVDRKPGIMTVEYSKETASDYVNSGSNDMAVEDTIASKLQAKVDRVFRGIIISAILFIACASACVVSVCIFCCHIRRSDRKLKNEVNALAQKLKIDINKKGPTPLSKKPRDVKEESCTVLVEDANVMCV